MEFYRIRALIRRHVLQMVKDLARLFDMVYWPLIDLILWGFTSLWFERSADSHINLGFILLSSLVLWGVLWRSNVDISISLLEELWSKNLVNLFASPLTLGEWIIGMMILGCARAIGIFFYSSAIVWLLYSWNIFSLGSNLFLYFVLLMLTGWSVGFFVAGLLIYNGQRFQAFVWAIGWLFSIIGAVFFPLNVLPRWMQIICKSFPPSYVFESIRIQAQTGITSWNLLAMALVLNGVYLTLSLFFFKYMFNKGRTFGLAQIEMD